jgi:hypothetical protein
MTMMSANVDERGANYGKILEWIEHSRQEDSGILALHQHG